MAIVAIPTTFLLIWPLATVTDVSVIVQFLVALIGLGIAIDYALLVVVRWREERLRAGTTNEAAVVARDAARGPAVVFSGTTVAISLLALVVAAGARPAQHRHRRHADRAGQRRGRHHAAAGRAGDRSARGSTGATRGRDRPREPRLVGLGANGRAPPLDRGGRVDRRPRRARRRGLHDPARQPARRLARPDGPGARRTRAARRPRASAPGRCRRSRRSSAPAIPRPSPRALAGVDGVQRRGRPRRLAPRRHRARHGHPDRGRQLGRGPRDARPRPRRDR